MCRRASAKNETTLLSLHGPGTPAGAGLVRPCLLSVPPSATPAGMSSHGPASQPASQRRRWHTLLSSHGHFSLPASCCLQLKFVFEGVDVQPGARFSWRAFAYNAYGWGPASEFYQYVVPSRWVGTGWGRCPSPCKLKSWLHMAASIGAAAWHSPPLLCACPPLLQPRCASRGAGWHLEEPPCRSLAAVCGLCSAGV